MSFTDSIKAVLTNYVGFSGRARRSEYWWFVVFSILVNVVARILDSVLFDTTTSGTGIIGGIVGLALFLPGLAVAIRRLHDTDRSGWWVLLALIPIIGAIVLIVFMAGDSKPGTNRFGANPKEQGAVAPGFAS
ncbi:DUF805 domain-containing protein [Asanoa ishikariensis]|uniref:Uncharacterized membrane protein YhaH, DUF805 family n=1 Tax=Asanoa ishikariensis TaxID=137265 RepID=A0A1H3UIN4_9ACTN|nr:DUF805 domain-containing protein [Asanoa ishikariensis]GIF63442.1 DUF805 domain-containing protein [Asanoa ishikariensis]SDZ62176.1 Uncharacterized membrane protein YhaH, DUF805 family [Asanoa ishikariensis]